MQERPYELRLTLQEFKLLQDIVVTLSGPGEPGRIGPAVRLGDTYHLSFAVDDLERMAHYVAAGENHASADIQRRILGALSDKIEFALAQSV